MFAALFSRVRCHFCGVRAPFPKTVTYFECTNCEAPNYLDGHGNQVDIPADAVTPKNRIAAGHGEYGYDKPFITSTRPEPEALRHQQTNPFCRTCTQNQHLYNETLSNYLPDESHPRYREFERAIPTYKKELEKRYPLVCTACAPAAQTKINRADYYGVTQNATALCAKTTARAGRSPIGQRDDAGKKMMRFVLNTIGRALYCGMLFQLAFHAYGILTTLLGASTSLPDFDITTYMTPSIDECVQQGRSARFTIQCFQHFANYVPSTIALAALGLLYNPGLQEWYHHTVRIETVNGQKNYFYMQLAILAVRGLGWWNMSDPETLSTLDAQEIIAINAFVIFFVLLTDTIAKRGISSVNLTIRGKVMPKPEIQDVLGVDAGPAPIQHAANAAEKDPFRGMRRKKQGPFDINSLAPKPKPIDENQSRRHNTFMNDLSRSHNTFMNAQQFTPEYSDDNYDPMELDDAAYVQSRFHNSRPVLQPSHTYFNHANAPPMGLKNMRDALSTLDRNMQSQDQRLRDIDAAKSVYNPGQAQTPFYGKLPPAPMSLERRLRNPPQGGLQRSTKEPLMSERKDFMQLMRNGVKPVEFSRPDRNNMELKQSDWVLPGDVKETGLEERFGSVFSLSETETHAAQGSNGGFWGLFGL